MADERMRWTDERLDDWTKNVGEDLGDIKKSINQIQSDEMQRLRERVAAAEQASRQGGEDRKTTQRFRFNLAAAVLVPLFLGSVGTVVTLLASHVI